MAEDQEVLLLIADISGYTRFMLKNAEIISHAQAVITELMNAVIKEARLPLKIAKLEGDAVFLYAADRGKGQWTKDLRATRDHLEAIFRAFNRCTALLEHTRSCDCTACASTDKLKLKLVVHAGKAHFYKLGSFQELAGPDVIVLHRLLKNSEEGKEYLMISDAAYKLLGYGDAEPGFERSVEKYEDVGDIPVRVKRDLSAYDYDPDAAFLEKTKSPWRRALMLPGKMWTMLVTAKNRKFEHLAE
jgi:hypothetical protein